MYLRESTMEDLPIFTKWAGDMDVMRHVIQKTMTPEEEEVWLKETLANPEEQLFTIVRNEDGKALGNCSIHLKPGTAHLPGMSLGILIGETDEWGKGYGTEAIRLLAEHTIETLAPEAVWLTVDAVNDRAKRAYEKAGFVFVKEYEDPSRTFSDGKGYIMEFKQ